MFQHFILILLCLFSGWLCINLSSAFIFHYQSYVLFEYMLPRSSTFFRLGWSLEIYTRRLANQSTVFYIDFLETFAINNIKIQEFKLELGNPRDILPPTTEEIPQNTPNNSNN